MRIHLIRHGQIPSNVTGALDTTVPGPSLTAVGQTQATALVERLKEVTLDGIWASTIVRTQETASPLAAARDLDVNVLDGLREISAGDMEMSINAQDRHTYHQVITRWILGDLDVPLANGETGHEVLERFENSLAHIEASGVQEVAVVAHGAIISFWAGYRCKGMTKELFSQYPVVNTGILVADKIGDDWVARSWMGAKI